MDTFPQFNRLPAEIRLIIWSLSLEVSRVVYIRHVEKRSRWPVVPEEDIRPYLESDFKRRRCNRTTRAIAMEGTPDVEKYEIRPYDDIQPFGLRTGSGCYTRNSYSGLQPERRMVLASQSETSDEALNFSNTEIPSDSPMYAVYYRARRTRARQLVAQYRENLTFRLHPRQWCLKFYAPIPALFHTCHEAAAVAAKTYQWGLCSWCGPQEYFDLTSDILFVDGQSFLASWIAFKAHIEGAALYRRYEVITKAFPPEIFFHVKRLAIMWDDWFGCELLLSWLIWRLFKSLSEVIVLTDDSDIAYDYQTLALIDPKHVSFELEHFRAAREDDDHAKRRFDVEEMEERAKRYEGLFDLACFRRHLSDGLRGWFDVEVMALGCSSMKMPHITLKTLADMATIEKLESGRREHEELKKQWDREDDELQVAFFEKHEAAVSED